MNTNIPQLATYLHSVCNWIMGQPRKCLLDSYQKVFNYVAFCHFTGKMSVSWKDGQIEAVAFHWPDFAELIEMKDAEGRQQFEFAKAHRGDALFVGECIGSRKGIANIYNAMIARFPNLVSVPFYTYRHGKCVKLSPDTLQRFIFPKEVSSGWQ